MELLKDSVPVRVLNRFVPWAGVAAWARQNLWPRAGIRTDNAEDKVDGGSYGGGTEPLSLSLALSD